MALLALYAAAGIYAEHAAAASSEERLAGIAAYLAMDTQGWWPSTVREADAWADAAGQALGVRVTLIDAQGSVWGDSQVAPGDIVSLENHRDRPEILEAARSGEGRAHRHSITLDRLMRYVARRIGAPDAIRGFIRVAEPAEALQAWALAGRTPVLLITLVSFLALGGVTWLWARRIAAALREASAGCEQVASGSLDRTFEVESNGDPGQLNASLERMRRSLVNRIRRAESEQRLLASILAGLREGILVVSAGRRILVMNASLRSTLHVRSDVAEGTPLIQVLWDHEVIEAFEKALTTGGEVRRRVTMPGGIAFELTVVPLEDAAGRGPGAIGLFFNVTQLEALERVRREFVADISHELRTPLASVKASVETLQGGAARDPQEADRFLSILAKNTARMEAILNDLTDLSLIETGSLHLSRGPVDLAAAVREAAAAVAPKAASRRISLQAEIPPGLVLHADRRRLDQILVNLLDNAVKFNRPGGSVHVKAAARDGIVLLEVEDTGPGIPPDALDRIFNRFYRVDRARSQEVPGTGLGLAIVKHLVRLHGGEIRAENRPEAGARFILEFPAHRPVAPAR